MALIVSVDPEFRFVAMQEARRIAQGSKQPNTNQRLDFVEGQFERIVNSYKKGEISGIPLHMH